MLRIKNYEEIGKKGFDWVGKKTYIFNNAFRPTEVVIDHVEIVQNRIQYPNKTLSGLSHGIVGAVVGGLVGFVAVTATQSTQWDADFDIFLTDGRILEVTASTEKDIKRLVDKVPRVDPHAKGRERRQKMKDQGR